MEHLSNFICSNAKFKPHQIPLAGEQRNSAKSTPIKFLKDCCHFNF